MTKKFNLNIIFIIFSICVLFIGIIALKYLSNLNHASIKVANIAEQPQAPSSCYIPTDDPLITKVNPDCN